MSEHAGENSAAHPARNVHAEVAPGTWGVAFPLHPRGWLGIKTRRACRKRGGHWWHPSDAMIAWRCCACGVERDGVPRDGS